jgi:translation elongation factor P/translation initiation factor 5A
MQQPKRRSPATKQVGTERELRDRVLISTNSVEVAELEFSQAAYSWADTNEYVFMDENTYEV